MAEAMSANGKSPAARVMDEAIELAIQERSPYPEKTVFLDEGEPSVGFEIHRAADEGRAVVLVAADGSTRTFVAPVVGALRTTIQTITASALGLAALATALTSTILTIQGALVPYWQWALLPSIAAVIVGLLATASAGAEHIGLEDVFAIYKDASRGPQDVGLAVLRIVRSVPLKTTGP